MRSCSLQPARPHSLPVKSSPPTAARPRANSDQKEMNMAARLPYLDREQVPPDVQAVYDKMKKATGRVLNTFRLMAHHARSVAPIVAFYGTLREGALDLTLRQLAYVKASQINGCHY